MSMKVAAHLVVCDNCGAQALAVSGQNVHDTLNCRCCGPDHVHGDPVTGETVNDTCRTVTVQGNSVVVLAVGGGDD